MASDGTAELPELAQGVDDRLDLDRRASHRPGTVRHADLLPGQAGPLGANVELRVDEEAVAAQLHLFEIALAVKLEGAVHVAGVRPEDERLDLVVDERRHEADRRVLAAVAVA